jgi:hypothetical protein
LVAGGVGAGGAAVGFPFAPSRAFYGPFPGFFVPSREFFTPSRGFFTPSGAAPAWAATAVGGTNGDELLAHALPVGGGWGDHVWSSRRRQMRPRDLASGCRVLREVHGGESGTGQRRGGGGDVDRRQRGRGKGES